MIKKVLSFFIDKIINKISETFTGIIFLVVVWLLSYFWAYLESLISFNPGITIIFLGILFVSVCYLGLKQFLTSRKKIINRILVDKEGECFCPNCSRYLSIIQNTKHPGERVFFCKTCDSIHHPYLENSKYISAAEFHAFQKENPQTVYTHHIAITRRNEQLKKINLINT